LATIKYDKKKGKSYIESEGVKYYSRKKYNESKKSSGGSSQKPKIEEDEQKIILPAPPEGAEGWTQEINPSTGKVRFVSGNQSTAWRTPEEWKEASKQEEQNAENQSKLKKDNPQEYVKTQIGKSGVKKIEAKNKVKVKKVTIKDDKIIYETTPRQEVNRTVGEVKEQVQFAIGKAGKTNLLMSPGLSKKYQEQEGEIKDIYAEESKTFSQRFRDNPTDAVKGVGAEIKARLIRAGQKTKEFPFESIREVFDPKTIDLSIKRTSTGLQSIYGVNYFRKDIVAGDGYFDTVKKNLPEIIPSFKIEVGESEKGKSGIVNYRDVKITSQDPQAIARNKGYTSISQDLNKQYKELTPVGKVASFGYGLGTFKLMTLPTNYFKPRISSKFTEKISKPDNQGTRTSTAKLRTSFDKPSVFPKKPVTTFTSAKIPKDRTIAEGFAETIKKASDFKTFKTEISAFKVGGKVRSAVSYPDTLGGVKVGSRVSYPFGGGKALPFSSKVSQEGFGAFVKIGKASRLGLNRFKDLSKNIFNPKKFKKFSYDATEYTFNSDISSKVLKTQDTYSFIKSSSEGLGKSIFSGTSQGIRKVLKDPVTKGLKGGGSGGSTQIINTGKGAFTITKEATKTASQSTQTLGLQEGLKGLQKIDVLKKAGSQIIQEETFGGLIVSSSNLNKVKNNQNSRSLQSVTIEKDITADVKIGGKQEFIFKIDNNLDRRNKFKDINRIKGTVDVEITPVNKQRRGIKGKADEDILNKVDITPIITPAITPKIGEKIRLKEITITKTTTGTPPPPVPVTIPPDKFFGGGLIVPGMPIYDDFKDYELSRGFRNIDISKILKGDIVFKNKKTKNLNVKLPKIKI